MNASRYFKKIASRQFIMAAMTVFGLMVITAGCNLPGGGESISDEEAISGELVDPNAQAYRMYYDSSSDEDESELQIRYFTGRLRMADIEAIFGDVDALPLDDNGNTVGGPTLADGLIWSLSLNPSQTGVNLVSYGLDGTINSAFDLDEDGIADIVDIRLGDGRRFSFATELLGMGLFERWLQGRNPLCDNQLGVDLGFAIWGCEEDGDGGEKGAESGGAGGFAGGGLVNPFDLVCAEYDTGGGARAMSQGGTRSYFTEYRTFVVGSPTDGNPYTVITNEVTWEDNGEWAATIRTIRDYDGERTLVQSIREIVVPSEACQNFGACDGSARGARTVIRFNKDGTRVGPNRLPDLTDFTANVDGEGNYDSSETNPPTPPNPAIEGEARRPADDAEPAPERQPVDTNPGPEGDDSRIAEYCEQRGTTESGVEQAADSDPSAFTLRCGDLVGDPSKDDDCVIVDWAGPGDFEGALEPSGNNCGEFEQPDEEGDCSGTSIEVRLQGLTAAVAAAALDGVDVCLGDLACDPADVVVALDNRQEISGATTQSFLGTIPNITLCFWGPGTEWGTVNSLAEGLEVEIVGIGGKEGWLIVANPNLTNVSCWVDEEQVDVPPGLDLGSLPVFEIPPLPDGGGGGAADPSAPAVPSGLQTNTIYGNPCQVELAWNDNSNNENGFRIYRDGILIGTVGANTTNFTDKNATETNGYNYSVRAYNAAGESSSTGAASVTCFG